MIPAVAGSSPVAVPLEKSGSEAEFVLSRLDVRTRRGINLASVSTEPSLDAPGRSLATCPPDWAPSPNCETPRGMHDWPEGTRTPPPKPVRFGAIIRTTATTPEGFGSARAFIWSYVDLRFAEGYQGRWIGAGCDGDEDGDLVAQGREFSEEQLDCVRAEVRLTYAGVDPSDWEDLPYEAYVEWNWSEPLDRP